MERLTKRYENGTHAAGNDLPCGENSWEYKRLLLEKLGAYEDTGLTPEKIIELDRAFLEKCREVNTLREEIGQLREPAVGVVSAGMISTATGRGESHE